MMCLSFRIRWRAGPERGKYKIQVERRLKEVISVFSNEMWVKARDGFKVKAW